jgi:hypothetical protein
MDFGGLNFPFVIFGQTVKEGVGRAKRVLEGRGGVRRQKTLPFVGAIHGWQRRKVRQANWEVALVGHCDDQSVSEIG